ncbi:MAG: TonB-dependent receptor plug domain-containing protein [Dysgonamonadaceae bacterium]|jgi:hypothetical protein|nr:TonB-dependent receptor plug domain-containing protein [Dysgonamonadaceae bacterium]
MKNIWNICRAYLALILLIFSAGKISGQVSQNNVTLPLDSAVSNILTQIALFPQEKIYLQTDKPYYISGEKIFFRAFLLDAIIHQPATTSRYVYVELVNPIDTVVIRRQIRPEKDFFYGTLVIPEDLPQGDYVIRAYTRFMTNTDNEYFFKKHIYIADPSTTSVKTEIEYDFINEKQVEVRLRFVDAQDQKPLFPSKIPLQLNNEKTVNPKPDNDGWVREKFNLSDDDSHRTLFAEFDWDKYLFRQFLRIPYPKKKFDVTFYPEGGNLVDGQIGVIAFKAMSSDGKGLDIRGEVFDSADNSILEFKTFYDGMGSFNFMQSSGKRYYAICHYGDESIKVDLPTVKSSAATLKTGWRQNKLWIAVNKSDDMLQQKFYLLVHIRGRVIYAGEWNMLKESVVIDKQEFPSGVSHVLLLTQDYQPVSERLVFVLNNDQAQAKIHPSKTEYKKRELVQMTVQVENEQNKTPLACNFAVSVTDDKDIDIDTTSNILSSILLTSELKGYIHNPAYYLQKNNRKADLAADLLMMTQGWTRYDIPKTLRGDFQYPSTYPENSQSFSGTVIGGLLAKPYGGAGVSIISLNQSYFDITETDDKGRFKFNFELPDSTIYIIQALNKKGKESMLELFVDATSYPVTSDLQAFKFSRGKEVNASLNDYISKADMKYVYENGMRMVKLPEVVVKSSRTVSKYKSPYYSSPDNRITEEELEKTATSDLRQLISRLPGVFIQGRNSIRIRNNPGPPLIVINGIKIGGFQPDDETTMSALDMVNASDVAQIDLLKTPINLAMYGTQGANGVIEIFTKSGKFTMSDRIRFNIKTVAPLGYQTPVEFYSPKYDTPETDENNVTDLRSTIYWNPGIIAGSSGETPFDFYTADSPSSYSIILEGISPEGKLIYLREKSIIETTE